MENIFNEILYFNSKYHMTLDAMHAVLWIDGLQFIKRNFIIDFNKKNLGNPKKNEKYVKALQLLQQQEYEKTESLKQTVDYFEKKYFAYNLDKVFPQEGVFTYRSISKMLESEYLPTDLYDKILNYLLEFEDGLNNN